MKRVFSYWEIKKLENKVEGSTQVYIAEWMNGHGVALPPLGILVGRDYHSELLKHEFGHILQYRKLGFLRFYLIIGIPSFSNMILLKIEKQLLGRNKWITPHHEIPQEKDANRLTKEYFLSKSGLKFENGKKDI